jgi:hypothetical protein
LEAVEERKSLEGNVFRAIKEESGVALFHIIQALRKGMLEQSQKLGQGEY